MNWVDVASNQCFSGNTLQNAVTNGYFVLKSSIPANGKMITKDEAYSYVYINAIPSKASNQLVVKSNLTAATALAYSYTLYFDFNDVNAYVGFDTSGGACSATNSVTVYSSSSTIGIGTALYSDLYGTERLIASTAGTGCSGDNYFKIGGNFITFEPNAALQCDGYIIDSIGTCSTTTTTTTTTSTTTTTTAAPSAGVDITNATSSANITNVTVNGVAITDITFPVTAGNSANGLTNQIGTYTIVVTYNTASGDYISITDDTPTTTCTNAIGTSRTFTSQVVTNSIYIEMGDGSCP